MARMLARSRSLRLLKSSPKEPHQQDSVDSAPLPGDSRADMDRLRVTTPKAAAELRAETPDLQRPRTSAGPEDRGRLFHRKVTPVARGTDEHFFGFPLAPTKSSNTTVLYAAEVHEDREGVIGIALGSPTMNSHWNTTPRSTDFVSHSHGHGHGHGNVTQVSAKSSPSEPSSARQEPFRPKLSRWKSIFGKKAPSVPEPKQSFYQLAQTVVPPRVDSHHEDEPVDSRPATQVPETQEIFRSVSPPTFRPEIRESRKLPKGQAQPVLETRPRALTQVVKPPPEPKRPLERSNTTPQPAVGEFLDSSPTLPHRVGLGAVPATSQSGQGGGKSLLEIDIPDIKMERYSVMFGSLLHPNSNQSSNRSSLLARRQGNSERLKPLNELNTKKEDRTYRNGPVRPHRRATSPSMPKSPAVSLSLFPHPTNTGRAPSPLSSLTPKPLRPHHRPKTAPASSPHQQSFQIPQSSDNDVVEALRSAKFLEKHRHKFQRKTEEPSRESTYPISISSSHDSFGSDSEEITIVVRTSGAFLEPQHVEPNWEIMSKPTQRTALTSHPASMAQEHPSSAPLESRTDTTPVKQKQNAPQSADRAGPNVHTPVKAEDGSQTATVGIARSISVSRASPRHADLLRPTLVKRATDNSERLVDKKPLTPTLVELKNRKSQRVQLVEA